MRNMLLVCVSIAALGAGAAAADQSGSMGSMGSMKSMNAMNAMTGHSQADMAAIASAMSAAPLAVSRNAAVMTMDAQGHMRSLRAGNNGFTCFPDDPATPGPDPMCLDANAMAWLGAIAHHAKPQAGKVGFVYMLAGGTDASNTDPFATKPAAGGHWIKTGPHVMVVNADPSFYASYLGGAAPDTSKPYVMWAGTPYQHLMAPVK